MVRTGRHDLALRLRVAVQSGDHEVHNNPIEHHNLEPKHREDRRPETLVANFETHVNQNQEDDERV